MPPLRFTMLIRLSLFRAARFHFGLGAPVGLGALLNFWAARCNLPSGVSLLPSSIKPWRFKLATASGVIWPALCCFLLLLRRSASNASASAPMLVVGASGAGAAAVCGFAGPIALRTALPF